MNHAEAYGCLGVCKCCIDIVVPDCAGFGEWVSEKCSTSTSTLRKAIRVACHNLPNFPTDVHIVQNMSGDGRGMAEAVCIPHKEGPKYSGGYLSTVELQERSCGEFFVGVLTCMYVQ